jgi:hypothetical protein
MSFTRTRKRQDLVEGGSRRCRSNSIPSFRRRPESSEINNLDPGLRRGDDLLSASLTAIHREGDQESLHLAHYCGVAFIVEVDVSFDPLQISLLGPHAVVLQPDAITKLVEKFWGLTGHIVLGCCTGRHVDLIGQAGQKIRGLTHDYSLSAMSNNIFTLTNVG